MSYFGYRASSARRYHNVPKFETDKRIKLRQLREETRSRKREIQMKLQFLNQESLNGYKFQSTVPLFVKYKQDKKAF